MSEQIENWQEGEPKKKVYVVIDRQGGGILGTSSDRSKAEQLMNDELEPRIKRLESRYGGQYNPEERKKLEERYYEIQECELD